MEEVQKKVDALALRVANDRADLALVLTHACIIRARVWVMRASGQGMGVAVEGDMDREREMARFRSGVAPHYSLWCIPVRLHTCASLQDALFPTLPLFSPPLSLSTHRHTVEVFFPLKLPTKTGVAPSWTRIRKSIRCSILLLRLVGRSPDRKNHSSQRDSHLCLRLRLCTNPRHPFSHILIYSTHSRS